MPCTPWYKTYGTSGNRTSSDRMFSDGMFIVIAWMFSDGMFIVIAWMFIDVMFIGCMFSDDNTFCM